MDRIRASAKRSRCYSFVCFAAVQILNVHRGLHSRLSKMIAVLLVCSFRCDVNMSSTPSNIFARETRADLSVRSFRCGVSTQIAVAPQRNDRGALRLWISPWCEARILFAPQVLARNKLRVDVESRRPRFRKSADLRYWSKWPRYWFTRPAVKT